MNWIKAFLSEVWNSGVLKARSIQQLMTAITDLTSAVRSLVASVKNLQQMQNDDRAAIEELYVLYTDILTGMSAKPPATQQKSKLTPIEQVQLEKKKTSIN